ncbi:chaplin family protein [Microbacterium oxydans]
MDQCPGRNSPELGSPGRDPGRGTSRDHERRGRRALGHAGTARGQCTDHRHGQRRVAARRLRKRCTEWRGAAAPASSTPAASGTSSGDDGTGSGTQVVAPVTAPVTVSGNAISLLGDSAATGSGTAGTGDSSAPATTGEPPAMTPSSAARRRSHP